MSPNTFTLADFLARAPYRPYCSDNLGAGLVVRPQATAVKRRYIQHNPPSHLSFMVFDFDRAGVVLAPEDAGLPLPSWITENRTTARGHIAYALTAPVITSIAGRLAPVRYAAAIEQGYRDALHADPGYTGLITKTPGHIEWITHWGRPDPYTLDELAEYLPTLPPLRKRSEELAGLGRNVSLFDDLRCWAYGARMDFGDFNTWHDAVVAHAHAINGGFARPLPANEVRNTAHSVAKWVWQRFNPAGFSAVQSRRGRRGGLASGARRTAKAMDLTSAMLSVCP